MWNAFAKDFVGDDGWTRLPLDRPAVLEYPVASRSGEVHRRDAATRL